MYAITVLYLLTCCREWYRRNFKLLWLATKVDVYRLMKCRRKSRTSWWFQYRRVHKRCNWPMMDDTAVKLCACNNEWILLVNFCSSLPDQLITAGPILDEFFAALPPLLLAHLKVSNTCQHGSVRCLFCGHISKTEQDRPIVTVIIVHLWCAYYKKDIGALQSQRWVQSTNKRLTNVRCWTEKVSFKMFPKDCRVCFSANAVRQKVTCWRSGVWKGTLAKLRP